MLFAFTLLTLRHTWSHAHKRQSKAVYEDDTLGKAVSQWLVGEP